MSKSNRSVDKKQDNQQPSGPAQDNSAGRIKSLLLFFVIVFLVIVAVNVVKIA